MNSTIFYISKIFTISQHLDTAQNGGLYVHMRIIIMQYGITVYIGIAMVFVFLPYIKKLLSCSGKEIDMITISVRILVTQCDVGLSLHSKTYPLFMIVQTVMVICVQACHLCQSLYLPF